MDYLLTPSDAQDFQLDAEPLTSAAAARWPTAERTQSNNDEDLYVLEWNIRDGEQWLTIGFQADGQSFGFSGHEALIAEAVLWAIQHYPASASMVFYDQGYSFDVPMSASVTEEELLEAIRGVSG